MVYDVKQGRFVQEPPEKEIAKDMIIVFVGFDTYQLLFHDSVMWQGSRCECVQYAYKVMNERYYLHYGRYYWDSTCAYPLTGAAPDAVYKRFV